MIDKQELNMKGQKKRCSRDQEAKEAVEVCVKCRDELKINTAKSSAPLSETSLMVFSERKDHCPRLYMSLYLFLNSFIVLRGLQSYPLESGLGGDSFRDSGVEAKGKGQRMQCVSLHLHSPPLEGHPESVNTGGGRRGKTGTG